MYIFLNVIHVYKRKYLQKYNKLKRHTKTVFENMSKGIIYIRK